MPGNKLNFETVRNIGLKLPDVEESTSYGSAVPQGSREAVDVSFSLQWLDAGIWSVCANKAGIDLRDGAFFLRTDVDEHDGEATVDHRFELRRGKLPNLGVRSDCRS